MDPSQSSHSDKGTMCSSSWRRAPAALCEQNWSRVCEVISIYLCGTVAAACFRLTSLIFRTCLCCVYSLLFPGHFGNSNLSLSLITLTTLSTSGLGLPECLICHAFYCSHIAGAVNACVAVYCLLLWRTCSIFTRRRRVLICTVAGSNTNLSTSCSQVQVLAWKSCVIFEI